MVDGVDGGFVMVSYSRFHSWQNGRPSGGMGAANGEWLVLAVDEVMIVGGDYFLLWEWLPPEDRLPTARLLCGDLSGHMVLTVGIASRQRIGMRVCASIVVFFLGDRVSGDAYGMFLLSLK